MNKKKLYKNTKNYHDELIESLHDPKELSLYLKAALEDYQKTGDTKVLLVALRNIAEAKCGVSALASKTHLNRQNLYKTLSKSGNPRLDTFGLVLKELGLQLSIQQIKR